ncbi:hypothetical protein RHMOL_Rhmol05G0020600 [Rhododendron molle]|uniref:Uncharacterized protein n=1 Tax=Rhododendron molle TaxID=49168 RepID=A0ACC0NJV1_RHOML|nr:hypothetical protein RHMOL_Rhmol05G0020600 [Rhododendron molle]
MDDLRERADNIPPLTELQPSVARVRDRMEDYKDVVHRLICVAEAREAGGQGPWS